MFFLIFLLYFIDFYWFRLFTRTIDKQLYITNYILGFMVNVFLDFVNQFKWFPKSIAIWYIFFRISFFLDLKGILGLSLIGFCTFFLAVYWCCKEKNVLWANLDDNNSDPNGSNNIERILQQSLQLFLAALKIR